MTLSSAHRRHVRATAVVVMAVGILGLMPSAAGSTFPVTAAARVATRATPAAPVPLGCRRPADHRFRPTVLSIRHVIGPTRVLARGRDRSGVPKPPPLTARGKRQFGWDTTVRAGARRGVVRLTAHTYPAWAGRALGNRLLERLRRGAVLVVHGPQGERLCYRVTRRRSVSANRSVPAFYDTSGPARLAILVCSGVRRGPGDWSRRTIWFAAPVRLG